MGCGGSCRRSRDLILLEGDRVEYTDAFGTMKFDFSAGDQYICITFDDGKDRRIPHTQRSSVRRCKVDQRSDNNSDNTADIVAGAGPLRLSALKNPPPQIARPSRFGPGGTSPGGLQIVVSEPLMELDEQRWNKQLEIELQHLEGLLETQIYPTGKQVGAMNSSGRTNGATNVKCDAIVNEGMKFTTNEKCIKRIVNGTAVNGKAGFEMFTERNVSETIQVQDKDSTQEGESCSTESEESDEVICVYQHDQLLRPPETESSEPTTPVTQDLIQLRLDTIEKLKRLNYLDELVLFEGEGSGDEVHDELAPSGPPTTEGRAATTSPTSGVNHDESSDEIWDFCSMPILEQADRPVDPSSNSALFKTAKL